MKSILTTILLIAFSTSPLSAQELTGTLHEIQKSGKIKIGYRQSQPPMSFLGQDYKPAGYSIDLCKQIVTAVKNTIGSDVNVVYIPVTAESRFAALTENKIDILCGSTTKTLSRSEIVDFTLLTFVTGASFMTFRDKDIRNDFKGKKIGVAKGTTTAVALKELLVETATDAEIVLFSSAALGFEALQKGKIDALSADQVVLIGLATTANDPENFTILPNLFSYEPFALAVRRNDADFRLVADRVLAKLYRTREIVKIYDKWFGRFSVQRPTAYELLIKLNAIPE